MESLIAVKSHNFLRNPIFVLSLVAVYSNYGVLWLKKIQSNVYEIKKVCITVVLYGEKQNKYSTLIKNVNSEVI